MKSKCNFVKSTLYVTLIFFLFEMSRIERMQEKLLKYKNIIL